jgi:hypothetical protein
MFHFQQILAIIGWLDIAFYIIRMDVYMQIRMEQENMTKKMTVVFHDEELYTDLKIEAVRRHRTASDIVSEAVKEWLETKESEELVPLLEEAMEEYKEKGGRSWEEVKKELDETIKTRKRELLVAERRKRV